MISLHEGKTAGIEKIKWIGIIAVTLLAAVFVIVFFNLYNRIDYSIFIRLTVFVSLTLFIAEIVLLALVSRDVLSPSILFLLSFYVFQNGQLLLYSLNVGYDTYYTDLVRVAMADVALFSSISNIFAGIAALVVTKPAGSAIKPLKLLKHVEHSSTETAALCGLIVVGTVSWIMLLIKFFGYALSGGYAAVIAFEDGVSSALKFADYMFVPFVFLYLTFSKSRGGRIAVFAVAAAWFLFTALCGDRTTGIAGLLLLIYSIYYSENDDKIKKKKLFLFLGCGILLVILIRIVFAFRTQEGIIANLTSGKSLIVGFTEELGFSFLPLALMMLVVPWKEGFLFGAQYARSLLAGIFPASLDVFGIVGNSVQGWEVYTQWIDKYFDFDFGVGFSLNAEAYVNFGWFGIAAIFLMCLIVFRFLSQRTSLRGEKGRFGTYAVITLLFSWLTLARRSSYYIWNAIFWCVIVVGVYLALFRVVKNKLDSNRAKKVGCQGEKE